MALLLLGVFLLSPRSAAGILPEAQPLNLVESMSIPSMKVSDEISKIKPKNTTNLYDEDPGVNDLYIPETYDISKFLMNNEMEYQNVWEPWLTKAAVRCLAIDPTKEFLAVGGGYLYDNEIHLYRWNEKEREFDKVWDTGDQIIQGDVLSIAFGDTDHNDFIEIVAGSADGHVYVFEQEHIYDPFDNMENQFVHVWTSPTLQQVWGVAIADVDKDYLPDIIAGSWDEKVHVYEYTNHSGYPFSKDHWIEYVEKTTIPVGEKIYSIATGDTNYNALPEIIVGTELGRVYIYENNGTILSINGKPWPLTQDNSYKYYWDTGNISWKPVLRTIVDNLDDDPHDEIVYISVGQNVFVVNFDESIGSKGRYLTHQLWEPLDSWELGGFEGLGHYLNHYIDWMSWSNNNIATGLYKYYNTSHYQRYRVFVNGSITPLGEYISILNLSTNLHVYYENSSTATVITEPYDYYVWEPQWPKNTSMAIHRKLDPWGETGVYIDMNGDGVVNDTEIAGIRDINHPPAENYTTFNARNSMASAIVDWGNDGEVMGDGLFAIPEADFGYDVLLRFHEDTIPNLNKISFEVSREGGEWALIPEKDISLAHVSTAAGDDDLWIDIDPILSEKHWAYFRYMRINVTNKGIFKIKGGYAPVLYRPIDTATSITIGSLDLDYYKAFTTGESEGKKIVLGTSDGKIIMFEYNSATKGYDLLWNSYKNDTYTQGTNIWDIVEVKSPGKIPTWLYNESESDIIPDLPAALLGIGITGNFATMDHANLVQSLFTRIWEFAETFFPGYSDIIELHIPGNDIIVGTDTGELVVFSALTHNISEMGSYFFSVINVDPFYDDASLSPTFVDFMDVNPYDPINLMEEDTLLLGWVKNDELYNPEEYNSKAIAGIDVYSYEFPSPISGDYGLYGNYLFRFSLAEKEITGLLDRALEKTMVVPDIATGDVDDDGDLDLVLTNGRIYYLENVMNSIFILHPEYFLDLNLQTTDKLYTSPELYDFDDDGDLDLSVGISHRPGATYFENIGHRWAPEWQENKWLFTNSWGGLRFNNLTSPTFAFDENGKVSHLTTFNNYTKGIVQLDAEYENHNAFVIGTNPIIARLEMNLKSGTDSHGNMLANYGYHVFETWNTEAELDRWTLTLKTGDMDQDGRGEVIVGDFDNNLYVFEHLTNNTYKRAYRSQDITHTELSTVSPYAWQELEGVSGTFYRTIWDHIEEIVINLDMDNDGFLEMVATAGLSIFVWEQNNDGFVSIDDEYVLIWQCDLRQSAWASLFEEFGISQFTASAYGGDLDYNGYGEFVLAAGTFLFVFESNGANQFYENFLVDPYPVRGRYFVPGNPLASPATRTLSIEAIVVDDTDNDTLNEIIIGGVNQTLWGQYNGFVCILENQIGTYEYTWWAPLHLMEDNPVYDLAVDNQDYDHYKEIIVGTFKGVVIYENAPGSSRDNNYVERSILTSFVNFPYIKLKAMFELETKTDLALRNTDFIELQYDFDPTYDVGTWIQIYKAGQNLYWAVSNDYGDNWIQMDRVTTSSFTSIVPGGPGSPSPYYSTRYEYHPSLHQTRDGRVWLAFTAKLDFGGASASSLDEGIWLLELIEQSGSYYWVNALDTIAIRGNSTNFLYNPSVWEYHNNTAQGVAISYIDAKISGLTIDRRIYWKGVFDQPDQIIPPHGGRIPLIGDDVVHNMELWNNKTGYQAISHDTIRSASGDVIIVFTGRCYEEAKVDLDLWIAKGNSTPIWDPTFGYSRATVDGIDELNPSITQTVTSDHTLMVIFEADGFDPAGSLQVTYSKDDGNSWRDPEPVSTTPPFAEYIVYPAYGFSLLVLKENHDIIVKSLLSVGPAITAHWEGGFAYSFMAEYYLFTLARLSAVGTSASLHTLRSGFSSSEDSTSVTTFRSAGDISAHSGVVKNIGGSMTTGGGMVSYQGTPIGYVSDTSTGGRGSAVYYSAPGYSQTAVMYQTPIVTGDEEAVSGYGGSIYAYNADAIGTDNPEDDQNTGSGPPSDDGGMRMTTATGNFAGNGFFSYHDQPDYGYFNNIFFGMNPSSNFTLFDFMEVRALSTGDSDKDFRREIVIASGSQAYLVEVARTGGTKSTDQVLYYYQTWHSDALATETTDIELYDANGNGMDEIIVSCIEGNVYSFEGINTNPPPTNYLFLDGLGSFDPLWYNSSYKGSFASQSLQPEVLLDTTDIGKDGVEDLYVAIMDPDLKGYAKPPIIRVLNGSSGEALWEYQLSEPSEKMIVWLKSVDLNLDGVKDVVFVEYNIGEKIVTLYALDGNTSVELWEPIDDFTLLTDPPTLNDIALMDLDNDSVLDILLTLDNTVYLVNGSNGNNDNGPIDLDPFEDGSIIAEQISVGNEYLIVSGRKSDSNDGVVTLLDSTGVKIHEFDLNNSRFGLTATLLEVTDDGMEDIVIIESGTIFVYYINLINETMDQLWNLTIDDAVGNYEDSLKYDFNGDSYEDLMLQAKITSGNHTITFEDLYQFSLSEYNRIADHYDGVSFSNQNSTYYYGWTILNTSLSGYANWVIPHSGQMLAYTVESDNYIIVKEKAYQVSAWFSTSSTYSGDYVWSAYDDAGNLLDSTTFASGASTQHVELFDPEGRIYKVQVSGSLPGYWNYYYVMDDFSYLGTSHLTKLMALSGLNMNEILWEYYLWDGHATEISQGDLDRDGEPDDLLFITEFNVGYSHSGAVSAIDGTYGTPFWNLETGGKAVSVAAGNFGDFGEAAVMLASLSVFMSTYVRMEPTYYQTIAIQMDGTSSFKTQGNVVDMAVGDFNKDGEDDVVFGDTDRYLIAIEGVSGEMIWKYRSTSPIQQIAVEDINNDGFSDVAVALESGMINLVSGETGLLLWDDYIGPVIVNEMEFVDVSGDGIKQELALSMGYRFYDHVGRFMVYKVEVNQGTRLWQGHNFLAPFTQFEVADFDNDGFNDIAVAIYEKEIWIFDSKKSLDTGVGSKINTITINVQDFKIGNFTGDSLPELAVIIRNGTILTYNAVNNWATFTISSSTYLEIPFRLSHLAIGDFSGNGFDDIVVRSFGDASYCFDAYLNELWVFEDRSIFYVEDYQVADLNNDTRLDVLTLNYDNIMALSGAKREPTQVIWASFIPTDLILSMTIGDFNGDEIQDVALGTADHWVHILYGKEEYLVEVKSRDRIMIKPKISSDDDEPILVASIDQKKSLPDSMNPIIPIFLIVTSIITIPSWIYVSRRKCR